jgi:hypothetical protein
MAANLQGPDEVEAILDQVETIVVETVDDQVEMIVEEIVVEMVDDQVETIVEEVETVEMVDEQIPKHFASFPT